MPVTVKLYLSIVVAIGALAGYFFQQHLGMQAPSYAALFFGVVAIVGMWIFPEVTSKKKT